MEWLDFVLFDNPVQEWLIALGVAAAVMIGLRVFLSVVLRRFKAFAERTVNDVDDLIAELLDRTRFGFILLIGLWAGSIYLDLPAEVDDALGAILTIGVLLQAGVWGNGVVSYLLERYRKEQADGEIDSGLVTALGVVGFIARFAIWVTVLLAALARLGFPITTFVASLGVGGIAVALALQNILSDLFASLSIIFDKPFVVGDFIVVGDEVGTVEHVGLKTTRVRALTGEQLIFSNSDLLSARIQNFKRMNDRRIVFAIGVEYGTPPERLEDIPRIIRSVIESIDHTRFDRSHFKGFGDSSVDFETVYFMDVPDYDAYMDVQQAINLELYRIFEEKGIAFAFPTRTLHLISESDGTPGTE